MWELFILLGHRGQKQEPKVILGKTVLRNKIWVGLCMIIPHKAK